MKPHVHGALGSPWLVEGQAGTEVTTPQRPVWLWSAEWDGRWLRTQSWGVRTLPRKGGVSLGRASPGRHPWSASDGAPAHGGDGGGTAREVGAQEAGPGGAALKTQLWGVGTQGTTERSFTQTQPVSRGSLPSVPASPGSHSHTRLSTHASFMRKEFIAVATEAVFSLLHHKLLCKLTHIITFSGCAVFRGHTDT